MAWTFPFSLLIAGGAENAAVLFQLIVVFGSAKLLAEIAERLKQPAIVGELLAGIILGPSLLNWIQPGQLLSTLAELGVIFLLFQVGLELKDFQLAKVGPTASLVAILGVLAPFALGWGIMALLGNSNIEAIFVGTAMVATSVGITARVLAAKGLLQEAASKVIMAAAVIDDVLGLLLLAVVSSVATGGFHIVEIATTAALAVGFTLVVAKWGTKTMNKIVPGAEDRLQSGEGEFSLALLLLFGLSLAAIYAGVAAIIGAFLAGMAMANAVSGRVHHMFSGVTEMLVPFFLVGIGLHLDVSVFRSGSIVTLAMVILVAACVSKFVGCGLGAFRLGQRDAIRVGVGMIPRGEVGMVVAQLGLGLGVISAAIYGVVVLMSIGTTLVAPPLLKTAYRGLIRSGPAVEQVPRVG
jgi:Kef-type K+ transport system membrane component KefB